MLFRTVWLEAVRVLARGDGTSPQRGALVWECWQDSHVDGEEAEQGAAKLGEKRQICSRSTANPRRQLLGGGRTSAPSLAAKRLLAKAHTHPGQLENVCTRVVGNLQLMNLVLSLLTYKSRISGQRAVGLLLLIPS